MRIAVLVVVLAGLSVTLSGSARSGCCPGPGGPDYTPVWSPSSSFIAFVRFGQIDIGTFVVRPDGTGFKQVSTSTTFSWAPDGERLVVGGRGLDIVDTEGRVLRQLTDGEGAYPVWSPDGLLIAFWGSGGIRVISAEGGTARLIARASISRHPVAGANRISWSPDSRSLAYVASRRLRKRRWDDQIHVVSTEGVGDRVVRSSPADEVDPVWSPNGTKIAFSAGGRQREVYVVNADGSDLVNLSSSRGYDGEPSWSPDGGTIAFASFRAGGRGLYAVSAAGGLARMITDFPEAHHPVWSPDGSSLAFSGRGDCLLAGILVVPASGGPPDLVTNDCYIVGSDGNDRLTGTRGRNIVFGRGGDDVISLDTGNDVGFGEDGDDVLLGDRMNDILAGGPGRDSLSGGRGNDRLWTNDGEVDDLDCGDQVDWVVADRLDRISRNCERVRRVRPR